MLGRLKAWWTERRAEQRKAERKQLEEQGGQIQSPGPGGWSPLGDLSKLSDDK